MTKLYRGRRTANSYVILYIIYPPHHCKQQAYINAIQARPVRQPTRTTLAVRDWATGIVEDPKVQAQLLADARAGRLHPSLMTALLAYAYGKPRETASAEPMIPMSQIEDARRSLQVKLEHLRQTLHVTST